MQHYFWIYFGIIYKRGINLTKTYAAKFPSTVGVAFSFVLLTTLRPCEAVDPYLVLLLEDSASYEEVTHQYEKLTAKLKSNSKLSQKKQKLYDEAYKEIVLAYVLEDKMTLIGP